MEQPIKPTIIDYLTQEPGYMRVDSEPSLIRPNKTVVATVQDGSWNSIPTQEEMVEFTSFTGGGRKQSLVDYLAQKPGYKRVEGEHSLRRPDNTVVASFQGGRWSASLTQEEMSRGTLNTGNGLTGLLYQNRVD